MIPGMERQWRSMLSTRDEVLIYSSEAIISHIDDIETAGTVRSFRAILANLL